MVNLLHSIEALNFFYHLERGIIFIHSYALKLRIVQVQVREQNMFSRFEGFLLYIIKQEKPLANTSIHTLIKSLATINAGIYWT